jgi:hypothetical protein
LGDVNLLGLLAWQLPSIIGADISNVASVTGSIRLETLEDGQTILTLFLVLGVVSLGLACLYLGAIAHHVRSNSAIPWRPVRRLGVNWIRLFSFVVLMILALVFLGLPLLLVAGFATILNPVLGRIFGGLLLALVLWAWIYLFFAVDAIFVSEVSPTTAIGHSVTVVRRNFWPSLRFVGLLVLIQLGLPLAWNLILKYPAAVPLAIAGNAYVATGLAAASMIFYRDRIAQWQKANLSLWGRDINP